MCNTKFTKEKHYTKFTKKYYAPTTKQRNTNFTRENTTELESSTLKKSTSRQLFVNETDNDRAEYNGRRQPMMRSSNRGTNTNYTNHDNLYHNPTRYGNNQQFNNQCSSISDSYTWKNTHRNQRTQYQYDQTNPSNIRNLENNPNSDRNWSEDRNGNHIKIQKSNLVDEKISGSHLTDGHFKITTKLSFNLCNTIVPRELNNTNIVIKKTNTNRSQSEETQYGSYGTPNERRMIHNMDNRFENSAKDERRPNAPTNIESQIKTATIPLNRNVVEKVMESRIKTKQNMTNQSHDGQERVTNKYMSNIQNKSDNQEKITNEYTQNNENNKEIGKHDNFKNDNIDDNEKINQNKYNNTKIKTGTSVEDKLQRFLTNETHNIASILNKPKEINLKKKQQTMNKTSKKTKNVKFNVQLTEMYQMTVSPDEMISKYESMKRKIEDLGGNEKAKKKRKRKLFNIDEDD
ncbi:hypothetical protein WDU94_003186 [Cyamophila willieti]